jgi:hypothetical protein
VLLRPEDTTELVPNIRPVLHLAGSTTVPVITEGIAALSSTDRKEEGAYLLFVSTTAKQHEWLPSEHTRPR